MKRVHATVETGLKTGFVGLEIYGRKIVTIDHTEARRVAKELLEAADDARDMEAAIRHQYTSERRAAR